ncbi:SagB/ThcOx family dehydrogenase [Streptomyces sp. NPDC048483]|uniref:SagB/ThcOx family dehydrogenase n=1 Tax=Streptomyces sp. NPDC048483 TaxID=3154927 RepID=UPI003412A371
MRLRRLRAVTCYWHEGDFVVHAYPDRAPMALHPSAAEILGAFETWTTAAQAATALGHLTPAAVDKAVTTLVECGLLVEEGGAEADQDDRLTRAWGPWAPEAAFFHYSTRDASFEPASSELRAELVKDGRPALFTEYPAADRVLLPRLPAPELSAPLEAVLYRRRTHRAFTAEPVALSVVAALLSVVFGPADFIDADEYGALIRRTSPGGGARQELDAYLAAPNIAGLAPGLFHYNTREHSLELLSEGFSHQEAARLCAHQEGVDQAAFLIFVVAAWERMRVKYRHPRAYRVSLLNAGHLGQTFALAATALGLGPFQSAAFDDTAVEKQLRLDGITRSALYVLAAGHPRHEPAAPAGLPAFRRATLR